MRFTDGTARSVAIWREVLEGLVSRGFAESTGAGSGVYRLNQTKGIPSKLIR